MSAGIKANADGSAAIQVGGSDAITITSGLAVSINGGVNYPLTSGTAVASTSGTSINFTSIPSTAKRITVVFNGVSTNGTSILETRLGTSGGIVATGYTTVSGLISTTSNTTRGATSATGFLFAYANAAADSYSGTMIFSLINSNTWICSGNLTTVGAAITIAGYIALSDTLTQVRITTVNGTDTFDAGSINILWE